jgi:anti-sigma regulatory factor (Ser/Thr protein kinase)
LELGDVEFEFPHVLSVALVSQRREIERLAQLVEQFGEANGFTSDDINSVNLLLDEIVVNIISHGYDDELEHQIRVTLTLERDMLSIRVEDDGRPFDPLEAPAPNLDLPIEQRAVGGLGIYIARSIADQMQYRREGNLNILTITKRLSAA